jgi:hypothetical protein
MDSRKRTKKERKKAICSELSTAVKKVRAIYRLTARPQFELVACIA